VIKEINKINNIFLPSAVFIAGPSKQLKKMTQIEHKIVENPSVVEDLNLGLL